MYKQICLAACCFIVIAAAAQNIGIGTNTPNASALLDISSTNRGLLIPRMTTTQMNAIASPAPGLLVFNLTDSLMYVRKNSGWTSLVPSSANSSWLVNGSNIYNSNTGNVGIGNSSPAHARLEINGSTGAAVAMFGADKFGVTIEADNPEIGFNYFYNNGSKTIKAGYAAVMGMNPSSGELYIGNFNNNESASDFGNINGYRQNITLFQTGELRIAGSVNYTHFYFGGNEDTYIRGGKDYSNVYINDITGGRTGIGTTALESQTVLTIKGPQYYYGIDVTGNSAPAVYAHGLNGAPALYLDGPIKVNTFSTYRSAYRLVAQSNNASDDGYLTSYNPYGHFDGGGDITINNPLCNNDPNALIFVNFLNNGSETTARLYKDHLSFDGTHWHIQYSWDKASAGDVFSGPPEYNILIIKTN